MSVWMMVKIMCTKGPMKLIALQSPPIIERADFFNQRVIIGEQKTFFAERVLRRAGSSFEYLKQA